MTHTPTGGILGVVFLIASFAGAHIQGGLSTSDMHVVPQVGPLVTGGLDLVKVIPDTDVRYDVSPMVLDYTHEHTCSADSHRMLHEMQDCAELSDAAYYPFWKLPSLSYWGKFQSRLWSFKPIELVARSNRKGVPDAHIWPFSQGVVVVVFKGTSTLDDIKYNIESAIIETPIGGIHSGFYNKWLNLLLGLQLRLDALVKHGFHRMLFTGHSLGGALATIAVGLLKARYPHVDMDLVTIASPRVGDHKFAFNVGNAVGRHMRVITTGDPVPRLPNREPYVHVPGNLVVLPDPPREKRRSWLIHKLHSHQLHTYMGRLNMFLQRFVQICSE